MNFVCLDEEFPPNTIVSIMGLPQSGKTYYSLENAFAVCKENNGSILFLSTEKPTDFSLKQWYPILSKKYGIQPKLNFVFIPNFIKLLEYVGIKGKLNLSEAKSEFILEELLEKSPIEQQLVNTSILIIDSITAPFDSLAVGGRQNLPLRAQIEEIFFNFLISAIPNGVRILTAHHITFNPTNPYEIREHIRLKGGKIIQHYSELVFALEHKDRPHGYRVLHVVRYPTIPEYGKSYDLLITNNGWKRTTREEIESLKKTK